MVITTHFIFGLIATLIGALPFGLVNLSVVNTTINKTERDAFLLSIGASVVEVFFAFTAIYLGSKLVQYIEVNSWINYIIIGVLLISGVFFIIKKQKEQKLVNFKVPYLIKGVLFNLISIQVFLYWFLAVAYLESNQHIEFNIQCISGFLIGVGLGKMLVLFFYRLMSRKIKKKSETISKSINLIIGIILLIISLVQAIKIL